MCSGSALRLHFLRDIKGAVQKKVVLPVVSVSLAVGVSFFGPKFFSSDQSLRSCDRAVDHPTTANETV